MTELLVPGENVLAARIDNAWDYREKATGSGFQWNDRNFNANYGGINRNVFLHVTDKLHQTLPVYTNLGTTGVYVYARDFDIRGRRATVTFSGNTPRSLGYVTISFPPAAGRGLKIELTGRPGNRDAFGQIIEIPGTPDANSAAGDAAARGTLAVIEAEIYEPAGGGTR